MNVYEHDARRRKARALARVMLGAALVFRDDGASCAEILTAFRHARPVERAKYAEAAEIRTPSDETWAMACNMLGHRLTTPMKVVA